MALLTFLYENCIRIAGWRALYAICSKTATGWLSRSAAEA